MKVIILKYTSAKGERLEPSDKPIEVDEKVGIDLINAQKAILAENAPTPEPKPKKKKAKKD
jgi:hypothetical protein